MSAEEVPVAPHEHQGRDGLMNVCVSFSLD